MSFFEFPHTRTYDSDLGWIIWAMKKLINEMDNFANLNSIKFANPIQWDITTQYEKNTVVVNPINGTAYLSVKPVPAGVSLDNGEYWTTIFTLDLTSSIKNITLRDDGSNLNATFPSEVNDWLLWNGILYKVIRAIDLGQSYIVGYNIERFTVEMFIREYINNVLNKINSLIGDLNDLTTEDKTNLVNAINSLNIGEIENAISRLTASLEEERQNRIAAIGNVNEIIGSLSDLETTSRNDIVSAINEVNSMVLGAYDTADIRNYGGVGDGVTNDTDAFNRCMQANGKVYLPIINSSNPAVYLLDGIVLSGNNTIICDFGASIKYIGAGYLFTIKGSNVKMIGITATFTNGGSFISIANTTGSYIREFIINNIITIGATHFIDDTASTSDYVSMYIDTVECKQQAGRCLNIHHSFAFLLIKDLTSDATGRATNANFAHFWFENSAGMQLSHVEAEGGLVTSYDQANAGFYFKNCIAVWIDKCLADTCAGAGFYQDIGCKYFYISNSASSLCCGFGFMLNGSNNQLTGCFVVGRKGMDISSSGAHGINSYSDITNISNVIVSDVTGNGIAVQSGRHLIDNAQIKNCNVGIGNTASATGYIHDCDVQGNVTAVSALAPVFYKDIFDGTTLWSNV